MELTGLAVTIGAIWGGVWTINSAVSAFLQTKWMYDQKKLMVKIEGHLSRIAGDDIQKIDSPYIGGTNLPTVWMDTATTGNAKLINITAADNMDLEEPPFPKDYCKKCVAFGKNCKCKKNSRKGTKRNKTTRKRKS